MEFRIKDVATRKGITLQEMCSRIGISYIDFNQRLKRGPKMELIQKCADALECSVFELIASDQYAEHSYNENGEWRGVLKKN
ncbi:Predicted transcriptional regulator [Chryseobacterium sp. JV274]|nr:Predicted transcriptional regulator [Chryseobacterium sp. JV274]